MKKTLFLLTLLFCHGCKKKEEMTQKPLTKVEAAKVLETTIPISLEGIGHVKAYNSAEIKAQVEGRLEKIHYNQGEIVKKGDLLITIDPRPFQAKVEQAEGELIKSEVDLKFAQEKVMRYSNLIRDDYVSKINFDEYVTNAQSLQGVFKKNQGLLEEAKVNLSYCFIQAPFNGRIGKKLIDEGNLIDNSGATLITLQQIEPVYVDFSLPEKFISKIRSAESQKELEIDVHLSEGTSIVAKGKLIVIDNSVDQSTGMIPLRAEVKNDNEALWPGQFAKIRLILKKKNRAIVVPDSALNFTQKGFFAYKISKDNKIEVNPIVVGERLGGVSEILSGINAGDLVVTNGQFNITQGQEVQTVSVDETFIKQMSQW